MSDGQGLPDEIARPVHHAQYYFEDGVVFLVENVLFKVPRYALVRESEIFADMFSLPLESVEGRTDAEPVHLKQVTKEDFERLLTLFYPLTIDHCKFGESWTEEEWTSILTLADKWEMSRARSMAIEKLDLVASPVRKIVLGRKYGPQKWIRDGFMTLCLRKKFLTQEEASQLALNDVVWCAKAREKVARVFVSMKASDDDRRCILSDPTVKWVVEGIIFRTPEGRAF